VNGEQVAADALNCASFSCSRNLDTLTRGRQETSMMNMMSMMNELRVLAVCGE
jgi:hypothetical protein